MTAEQRERLRAPEHAAFGIALIRPTPNGELPTRRVFEDRDGNEIAQFDIWRRGYDARQRGWYINASKTEQLAISEPYISFSLAVPMLTISAPLHGRAHGVVGLDLKLDSYSAKARVLQFGKTGSAVVFNGDGKIIAHPNYGEMFSRTMTDPRFARLPTIDDLESPLEKAVLADWRKTGQSAGKIRWSDGQDYLLPYRERRARSDVHSQSAADRQRQRVCSRHPQAERTGQDTGPDHVPAVHSSGVDHRHSHVDDVEVDHLAGRTTARPWRAPSKPIGSFVRELNTLGTTVYQAQRAVWSFSRLAPREIVRGVLNGTISTELGGTRQEITAFFTDVRGSRRCRRKPIPMC